MNNKRKEVDKMDTALKAFIHKVAQESGLDIALNQVSHYPAAPFHPQCKDAVRRAAINLGYSHMDIVSGAGHDACWTAKVAPTTMIFCPCVGGLSHNEAEEISPEWVGAGADVLLHAVLETAEVVR